MRATTASQAADEYDALFLGVGKSEVFLYGSYYLSGFLNEKPLAVLRADLATLGLTQATATAARPRTMSPTCFEVMRYLIAGDDAAVCNLEQQRRFFRAHVQTWVEALCDAVEAHPRAEPGARWPPSPASSSRSRRRASTCSRHDAALRSRRHHRPGPGRRPRQPHGRRRQGPADAPGHAAGAARAAAPDAAGRRADDQCQPQPRRLRIDGRAGLARCASDYPGPLAGLLAGLERCETPYLVTVPCDTPNFPDRPGRRAWPKPLVAEGDADIAMAATVEDGAQRTQPVFCLLKTALMEDLVAFMQAGERKIDRWTARHRCVVVPFDRRRRVLQRQHRGGAAAARAWPTLNAPTATAGPAPPCWWWTTSPACGTSCRRRWRRASAASSPPSRPKPPRALLQQHRVDLVLLDIALPGKNGIAMLKDMRAAGIGSEVVLITAFADLDTAIEALRAGAGDMLLKPFRVTQALGAVRHGLERAHLRRENWVLRRAVSQRTPPADALVGRSIMIKGLQAALERVATVDSTVLLTGESGTGKELAALALHRLSPHAVAPFVPVNCATAAPAQLEAELFGQRRRRRPVRLRRGRHALPRRDRRAAAAAAGQRCCACSRTGGSGRSAANARCRSTCASSRRPTARWPPTSSPAASVPICSTGCRWSRSSCRRCVPTRRTSPTSSRTSSTRWRRAWACRRSRSRPTRCATCCSTTGRATCASCAT